MSELRSVPVDANRWRGLLCVSAPEPRMEYGTTDAKIDRVTGEPQYVVGVLVKEPGDRKAYIIDVSVPGMPSGIVEGQPVVMHNLRATPWNQDNGNAGISFRADAITAATPTTPPASASGVAASAAGESSSSSARSLRGGGGS
jgi:hypothetical protein